MAGNHDVAESGLFPSAKADVLASVVVFLVALPLCMGVAIASGAPPDKAAAVGLMTGIIGGLVVGFIGGSPLQVSGPAAGLSVIIFELMQRLGWEQVGLVVLGAGFLQFLAGCFKLGQWFRAVSPAVIHGMLAGIGVLIIASQFHIMVDDQPRGSGLQNLLSLPEAIWKGLIPSDEVSHDDAARIGVLTILVISMWKWLAFGKLKVIPPALVAIGLATVLTVTLELPIKQVAVPDNLLDAVTWPDLAGITTRSGALALVTAAASLAFVASAETLLCAAALDKLHHGARTRYDRELAAQGVGNMLCGLLGALPMTGVIVRSAVNVEAGARTRLSAILHGAWLLLMVTLCPFVLRYIPTASLAALLVYTGFKLLDAKAMRMLWGHARSEFVIWAVTVGMIVVTDLLTGVITGVILSAMKLLNTFAKLKVRLVQDADKRTTLRLRGAATFLRLPTLAAALESVPPSTELHVHFEGLTYIDHACLELLLSWEKQHETSGGRLVIDWDSMLERVHKRAHAGADDSVKDLATVRAP